MIEKGELPCSRVSGNTENYHSTSQKFYWVGVTSYPNCLFRAFDFATCLSGIIRGYWRQYTSPFSDLFLVEDSVHLGRNVSSAASGI